MRPIGVAALVILSFIPACTSDSKAPSSSDSSAGKPPVQQAEAPHRKGRALVTKLPDGAEGVELADGGLRVLKGYKVEHDKEGTFFIARISTGRRTGTSGSCKCTSGTGKCTDGGAEIVVCVPVDTTCTKCGLALTIGGVTTPIFIY